VRVSDSLFEDVVAALRGGYRMQLGGGRSFSTYEAKAGQIVVVNSCDGELEEWPCSDEMLRAAIAEAPHVFRQYVEWSRS
jgi:hypothetical protein